MQVYTMLFWLVTLTIVGERSNGTLVENFYNHTCPELEAIVKNVTDAAIRTTRTFSAIPGTLRLFFHDCFVEGCDASIMIESTNQDAEKDAEINHSLVSSAFEIVIQAKKAVEAVCPGIVSCADILAIAARDVVVVVGVPNFSVELGRRDGLISKKSRVEGNLPHPTNNLTSLNANFAKKNLSQFDMIALSGAHTIGFSHCASFMDRLYSAHPDPFLNKTYARFLKSKCPEDIADPKTIVQMDPETPKTFDSMYYKNLMNGKGLFTSDALLYNDTTSRPLVIDWADSQQNFFSAFVQAMIKLGRVGVKTGNQGEIRKDCTAFNP